MKVTTDGCLFGAWCAAALSNTGGTLADIGAGTGLLSLMIAQKTSLQIDAVELDEDAARQAGENVAASPWKDRVLVHHKDIIQYKNIIKYDHIASNPPFYENELAGTDLAKNRAHHDAGLRLPQLLDAVERLLAPDGSFFLLLPHKRKTEALSLLRARNWQVNELVTVRQSVLHGPFRLMIRVSRTSAALQEREMLIRDAQQEYTPEFVSLLRDYYLYL